MLKGFIKTLFGDFRNIAVAASCVLLAAAVLHTNLAIYNGLFFPLTLLAGAIYLAWH